MKAKIFFLSTLVAASCAFTACNDDDDVVYADGNVVALDTPEAVETGATYLSLSTPFHIKDDAHWTRAGYCVGTTENPTIYGKVYDAEVTDGMAFGGTLRDGYITATIPSLRPNVEYHVRAFVSQYKGSVVYSPDFVIKTEVGTLDDQLAAYEGPEFRDDYSSFAGWDQRDKWNLANVHDPSVVKADDGYYYMYQTDASY
ncbi:MAG: arabinan endo-1,5-alpha-L-arabinosidase, partial [Duncaniella sp.]|nr:arabinan endo-1,5-alpha-L-arabinosidase [Duncaniella sp.]